MGKTSIEWTDRSINPIRFGSGHYCQKISPGCANCYASRMQVRFGNPEFGGHKAGATGGDVWIDRTKLDEVLRLRKPSRIFWCDMTDLFGDWVPDGWIDCCFSVMAATPQHTHQVLTKRPDRMAEYLANVSADGQTLHWGSAANFDGVDLEFPLPNVWLGVSCEDQKRADERIPHLLRCPATVRFLSCEPLLGRINLGSHAPGWLGSHACEIDWVIVGGESGPKSRPMHPDWVSSLRDQCTAAGVPFFFKQWGEYRQTQYAALGRNQICMRADGHQQWCPSHPDFVTLEKVGKKSAGRLLDGVEWSEFPGKAVPA